MATTSLAEIIRRAERAANRQYTHGNPARRRRRMTRSNVRYAVRPTSWRAWIDSIKRIRLGRDRSTPIPVSMRPWVPRVRQQLDAGDQALLDRARQMLPRWQFTRVYATWL